MSNRFRGSVLTYVAVVRCKRAGNIMFSKTLQIISLTCFLMQIIPAKSQVCLTFVDSCPTSWHLWGNSCYRVTETGVPWARARDECDKLGGALVVPRTLQENNFIGALIPAGLNAWIDCDDLDENDSWVCRDDGEEVLFRNWDLLFNPPQPNGGTQRCVLISREWSSVYLWHDHFCQSQQRSACKKPARPRLLVD